MEDMMDRDQPQAALEEGPRNAAAAPKPRKAAVRKPRGAAAGKKQVLIIV